MFELYVFMLKVIKIANAEMINILGAEIEEYRKIFKCW